MNPIDISDASGSVALPESFKSIFQTAALWFNRSVELIEKIPEHLQQNPSHAITVFTVANVVFFFFIQKLARMLDERVSSSPKQLNDEEIVFNQFLINGLVVGGSTLTLNVALTKLLSYPLNKTTLAAIAATQIAFRIIFSKLFD